MKRITRAICLMLACSMLFAALLAVTACNKDTNTPAPSNTPLNQGNNATPSSNNNANKVPLTSAPNNNVSNINVPTNWGIEADATLITVVFGGNEYVLNASRLFEMDRTDIGSDSNDKGSIGNYNGVRIKDMLFALDIDTETVRFNNIILHHSDGSTESLSGDMSIISPFECVISPYKNKVALEPQKGLSFIAVYLDKNTSLKEFADVIKIEID